MHKFERVADTTLKEPFGQDPPNGFEVGADIPDRSRVIVGVSIRMAGGNITTLQISGRRLDPDTGKLVGDVNVFTAGSEPHHSLEVKVDGNNLSEGPNRVLTGLWARAHPGNITSLKLWTKSINEDGQLEGLVSVQAGSPPPSGFEAELILPRPFVATGIGLRAHPGNVTHLCGEFSILKPTYSGVQMH